MDLATEEDPSGRPYRITEGTATWWHHAGAGRRTNGRMRSEGNPSVTARSLRNLFSCQPAASAALCHHNIPAIRILQADGRCAGSLNALKSGKQVKVLKVSRSGPASGAAGGGEGGGAVERRQIGAAVRPTGCLGQLNQVQVCVKVTGSATVSRDIQCETPG
ncbi:hypothetical protein CRENBAI_010345 [Crenichthys baileyi]|uniref:Uncharacterized protein n=1 Tax=Crenichthys baileyi TaxID=28760 RepID=A0AAV9RFQ7_9TELE